MNASNPDHIIPFLLGQREVQIIRLEADNKRLREVLSFIEQNMDEKLSKALSEKGFIVRGE